MQLQNGYDVASELSNRPHHHQLLPSDHPLPPPNHQFQLFLQHQQPVNVLDPFLNFRAGAADPHINAAAPGLAPPPSVVVAPQALRWINHQDDALFPKNPPLPLWKCEGESNIRIGHRQFDHKSASELQILSMADTTPNYTQFRSKPEFDKPNSCPSPGSASEIYESTTNQGIASCTREVMKKKNKKKHKLCTDSELKTMAGLVEARLAAHQERLHARFTEAIERMERARKEREDTWRAADARAARAQAADRAREQALASAREAAIVSFLERMTGQKVELPALVGPRAGLGSRQPGPKRCNETPEDDYCDVQYSNSENVLEAMLELQESNARSSSLYKDDHGGQNQS